MKKMWALFYSDRIPRDQACADAFVRTNLPGVTILADRFRGPLLRSGGDEEEQYEGYAAIMQFLQQHMST